MLVWNINAGNEKVYQFVIINSYATFNAHKFVVHTVVLHARHGEVNESYFGYFII